MLYKFNPLKKRYSWSQQYWMGVFNQEIACTRVGSKSGKYADTRLRYFIRHEDEKLTVMVS